MPRRRLFTLLFTIVVFADLTLTACVPPSPKVEPVVITFVTYRAEYYRALAEAFHQENPAVEVQVHDLNDLITDASYEAVVADPDFSRRLVESADVVPIAGFYPGVNLYDGIRMKLLRDLRPFLDQDPALESLFIPQTIEALTWQGSLYGLPWSFSVPLLLYNKQLFDAAGVPYPAEDWTWDDFLSTAQALTDASKDRVGFVDTTIWTNLVPLALIIQSGYRVTAFVHATPEATLDDPAVIAALEWYVDLNKAHDVMPILSPYGDLFESVCSGRAAMWGLDIRYSLTIHSSRDFPCVSGAIARWPRGNMYALPLIVDGFGISAGTRYPEAAWRWLAFLSRKGVPPEFSEWSALRSEFESETVAQDRGITQEAVDAVRAALANAVPAQIEYGALKSVLVRLPEVYAGQKTVTQLLQETAQVRARVATPEPLAVSTPAPPTAEAKTTIVFVPRRDRMGTFEEPTLYKALVDEFHRQNPDIQVEVRTFTGFMSDEDIARQSDVFLGRRRVPFEQPRENQYVVLVQDLGPLMDTDPTFSAADLPMVDFSLPPGYAESAAWGIPVSFDAMGIFYDRDRFQAAGVASPGVDWTWDDFRLAAAQVTSGEGDSKQYGYVSRPDALDLELFLLGSGFTLPGDYPEDLLTTGAKMEEQLPKLEQALTWWVNLAQTDQSMPPIQVSVSPDLILSQRRVAMWADFLGNYGHSRYPLYNTARSESWAIGFAPMPRGARLVAAIWYDVAYISASAKHREACWKWVHFLSEHLPPGTRAPARRALLESEPFRQQVGEEMQAAYLQAADAYTKGEMVFDRTTGSGFLYVFVRQIEEGEDVSTAIAQAWQQTGGQ